jgi:hypothetical protein
MISRRARVGCAILILTAATLLVCCDDPHRGDSHWEVEADARPSKEHPFAGFWKSPSCDSGDWGLAIGPMETGKYYVSFCGPSGCFDKGEYRPITTLHNDPRYRVFDDNTIEVEGQDGFSKYIRCPGRSDETASSL